MFQLEPYKGINSRHNCPSCGAKRIFVRYINENREYLADNVGRCNRESKCGYHYSPKMYFADHPEESLKNKVQRSKRAGKKPVISTSWVPRNYHSKVLLDRSLSLSASNSFLEFLFDLFPDDPELVCAAADRYFVGLFDIGRSTPDLITCFWQIDIKGRIRKGKLMRYDARTGRRQPVFNWTQDGEEIEIPTYWVHKALQKNKELPENVNFQNCFFGEHLLRTERGKTVAIVEAEKTAVISSICFPEFVWIAIGAQSHLTGDRLNVLQNRKVILYPDADAFEVWKDKTTELQRLGIQTKCSSFIDEITTQEQKSAGYDLADYLIEERKKFNAGNERIDRWFPEPEFTNNFIPPQSDHAGGLSELITK